MKNTMSKALWGVFFVLLGISLAGRAVGVFDFNLYFPGWWTLFIIVPSAIGLVSSENRTASLFGLGIGILLLISVQGIVAWYNFPRLMIALIFVAIGFSILFRKDRGLSQNDSDHREYNQDQSSDKSNHNSGGYHDPNGNEYGNYRQDSRYDQNNSQYCNTGQYSDTGQYNGQDSDTGQYNGQDSDTGQSNGQDSDAGQSNSQGSRNGQTTGPNYNSGYTSYQGTNHGGYNHYTGFFSGRNIQFVDEEFTGADVTSILGNVQSDLRNAILKDDVVIETTCILGGVDVYVPNNAKVVLNCTPILGGVENKVITPYSASGNTHTIFIRGTCILGGIEVK